MSNAHETSRNPAPTADSTQLDAGRRAVLDKLGRLAVYTPPTMMALMLSKRASAASCGGPLQPPCPPV
ncbi:hypothetical protein ThimaDRAFT_4887 [Thiocapsa marina 5811]|uniref:Uncharacterized protein n=1 Tax=Thiocapsa marina 5811 TaxID=768671 RepID=F9UIY4_9GAMM|nr:hypothetical protein ThimaDRAFT_4887 [Thiocapsa marina 5811]